ncbi:MAG: hypothetical protein GAK35_02041 [Herbaspirillum frisingense]|uniref:Uncharacterized protein n=1 Tax=Herbaspirillum frisingense TaxID=92645 RepID=A0A7V8FWZ0_9BURK|nr:MAG: hypothetical protein GAK35_02041 [Herbaspirillum frisingense]
MSSDMVFEAMLVAFLILGLLVFAFFLQRTVQMYRLRRDAWFAVKRFLGLLLGSLGGGMAAVIAGLLIVTAWEALRRSVGTPACAGACYGYAAAAQAEALALVVFCFYLGFFGCLGLGAEVVWRKARSRAAGTPPEQGSEPHPAA